MNLTFEAARWALVLLIALLLGALGPALDGPSDDEAAADTAADLHAALADAQAENPGVWDADNRARAHAAVAHAATWRADARSVGCHR
jgi:hypothetical protein